MDSRDSPRGKSDAGRKNLVIMQRPRIPQLRVSNTDWHKPQVAARLASRSCRSPTLSKAVCGTPLGWVTEASLSGVTSLRTSSKFLFTWEIRIVTSSVRVDIRVQRILTTLGTMETNGRENEPMEKTQRQFHRTIYILPMATTVSPTINRPAENMAPRNETKFNFKENFTLLPSHLRKNVATSTDEDHCLVLPLETGGHLREEYKHFATIIRRQCTGDDNSGNGIFKEECEGCESLENRWGNCNLYERRFCSKFYLNLKTLRNGKSYELEGKNKRLHLANMKKVDFQNGLRMMKNSRILMDRQCFGRTEKKVHVNIYANIRWDKVDLEM
ncbi:hypothetical protein WN51_12332 [Melipona quadrifasciata]|uniref:Uncharacterized protein n=1 Tax=Melipona quadrifasciata TaxID=166423 RepID=A0A0N0U5R9_9HYME|nr:hypothetical protein WN51_12332 [Melipona quadrifasciata]